MSDFFPPINPIDLPKPGTIRDFGFARGVREDGPRAGSEHYHQGVDLGHKLGVELHAMADGIVTHAHNGHGPAPGFGGYGRIIVVQYPELIFFLNGEKVQKDLYSLYGHCGRVELAPGDVFHKGDLLALVGNTAFKKEDPEHLCAAHLHFELALTKYPKPLDRKVADWGRINPVKFFEENRFDQWIVRAA